MKQLQISDNIARKIYGDAAPELKTILEENFGKVFFSQKITDRVKSFEDACKELGIQVCDVYTTYDEADEVAYKQLKTIAKALNEGWTPDWNNDNQQKWWPWFYLDRFRLDGVYYDYTGSAVGSRLCFKSRELAEYAANQFSDLYKQFLTL
jgi:hypothetical protein